ncbi:MAG TPA: pyridoxal-phosphate dependent enzyme, partial [Acidimicrobiia bacterium]|nr:pyridoxal-phosphate dependent enzyme [Acidimicrobiia bacterium]
MDIHPDILSAVGGTPLVRLSRLHPAGNLLAKVEFVNPGGSVKDRIAASMIDEAEAGGLLRPGGTIVEATSGNTGAALAMLAAVRGYHLVAVMADKQSKEKQDLLRAYGAEVVICPSDVAPDDPRSHYSTAARMAAERGAFRPDQYANPA